MIRRKYSIIIFTDNKNVLIQDRRDYKESLREYGFFGGGIEEGETPEQAIKREIMEELSIQLTEFKLLRTETFFHPDVKGNVERSTFTAKIPDLNKVKCLEGKPVLTKIKDALTMDLSDSDKELLREIQKIK